MDETIILRPGDERLGRQTPDEYQFPEKDILGNPAVRGRGGVRHLGNGYIVVIPKGFKGVVKVEHPMPKPLPRGGEREL